MTSVLVIYCDVDGVLYFIPIPCTDAVPSVNAMKLELVIEGGIHCSQNEECFSKVSIVS